MRSIALLLFTGAGLVAGISGAAQKPLVWQLQDSGTTADLRGIDSVDGKVAWASGSDGTVLRTTDGGAHWQACVAPANIKDWASLDFRGIEAWDSATAMVMASGPGDKSRLYETQDACTTWALVFKNPDSPGGFFDSFWLNTMYGQGLLLGDPVKGRFTVFATQDGGQHWKRETEHGLAPEGEAQGAFAASNSAIARDATSFLRGFVTGGKKGAYLYERWGGPIYRRYRLQLKPLPVAETGWTHILLPLASGFDSTGGFSLGYRVVPSRCRECKLGPDWHFVAVGGNYSRPDLSAGSAAFSLDGGQHWTTATTPPHGYRSAVVWSTDLNGWIAVGTNGSDISRDDGRTWEPLDKGDWNAISLPFVVGPKGRIAKLSPDGIPRE